jgi:hypothetical protein
MRCGNSFLSDLVYTVCIDFCRLCVYVFGTAAACCHRRNTFHRIRIARSLYIPARALWLMEALGGGGSEPSTQAQRPPSSPATGSGAIEIAAVDERWLSLYDYGL